MVNNDGKIFEIPKWEYKRITFHDDDEDRKELSELGKKGWEGFGMDGSLIMLKRQIGTVRLMEVPKEQSPTNNRDGGYGGY